MSKMNIPRLFVLKVDLCFKVVALIKNMTVDESCFLLKWEYCAAAYFGVQSVGDMYFVSN